MLKPIIYFLFFLGLLVIQSCNKSPKIIEYVHVAKVQKRNLPNNWQVVEFEFVDEQTGYAVCLRNRKTTWGDSIKVFKTENGGFTWWQESFPIATCRKVQGMAIQDIDNGGILIDNVLYHLAPGIGWSEVLEFGWPLDVTAVDKASDGVLYFTVDQTMYPQSRFFKWPPNDMIYTEIGTFQDNHIIFTGGKIYNDTFYLFDQEYGYANSGHLKLDIATLNSSNYYYSGVHDEYTFDIFKTNSTLYTCNNDGAISWQGIENGYYNYHLMDYYALENLDPGMIAVGQRSISSDISGKWCEVLQKGNLNFSETFLHCQRINSTQFYVSGENGVFYKITL